MTILRRVDTWLEQAPTVVLLLVGIVIGLGLVFVLGTTGGMLISLVGEIGRPR